MVLLRSEEDAPPTGASMPVEQLSRLAKAWYGNRLDPGWRPRTNAESQVLLEQVGLTGDFWNLG